MVGRVFAPRSHFTPRRGEVIMLDFRPHKGKETPDEHPAVVISDRTYNGRTELAIVCPISHSLLGNPFAVEIPGTSNLGFHGFCQVDHVRNLAYRERNPRSLGMMPVTLMVEITRILHDIMDPT